MLSDLVLGFGEWLCVGDGCIAGLVSTLGFERSREVLSTVNNNNAMQCNLAFIRPTVALFAAIESTASLAHGHTMLCLQGSIQC